MKNEIKEIKLDHFKDLEELKQNVENWIATDEMYWERWFGLYDIKALLDYITNLQERFDALLEAHKIADELETEYQERNEKALEINQKLQMMSILDSRATLWLWKQEKVLQGDDKE